MPPRKELTMPRPTPTTPIIEPSYKEGDLRYLNFSDLKNMRLLAEEVEKIRSNPQNIEEQLNNQASVSVTLYRSSLVSNLIGNSEPKPFYADFRHAGIALFTGGVVRLSVPVILTSPLTANSYIGGRVSFNFGLFTYDSIDVRSVVVAPPSIGGYNYITSRNSNSFTFRTSNWQNEIPAGTTITVEIEIGEIRILA